MAKAIVLGAVLLLGPGLSGGGSVLAASHRIASLNLCADQIILMLADRSDIVGLSPLAADCANTVLCELARGLPSMRPTGEAVLARQPDVVFSSPFTAVAATAIARQAGLKTVDLPIAESLADVPEQIWIVARAIGREDRAEAIIAPFRARLAQLQRTMPADRRLTALVYEAHGFVVHKGSLADEVLTLGGFRNMADEQSVFRGANGVPLEALIANRADLLVIDRSAKGYSLAQAMLENPVLRQAYPAPHQLDVPARLWLCALPQTLDAVTRLRAAHARLEAQ